MKAENSFSSTNGVLDRGHLRTITVLFFVALALERYAFADYTSQTGHTYFYEDAVLCITDSTVVDTSIVDTSRIVVRIPPDSVLTEGKLDDAGFPDSDIVFEGMLGGYNCITVPDSINIFAYIDSLESWSLVEWARFDIIGEYFSTPNDSLFPQQWGLSDSVLNASAAWDIQPDAGGILVGLIDFGMDTSHDDLPGHHIASSSSPLAEGGGLVDNFHCEGQTADVRGHGTSVAGLIAASTNNSIGVASIGGQWTNHTAVQVFIYKMSCCPTTSEMCEGITRAVENGARVINLSSGDSDGTIFSERDLYDAIEEATRGSSLSVHRAMVF